MVLIKRPSRLSSLGSELPLGNTSPRFGESPTVSKSNKSLYSSSYSSSTTSSWASKVLFFSILVSSAFAYFAVNNMHDAIRELETAEEIQNAEYEAARKVLGEALASRKAAQKKVDKLNREVNVLNHEIRADAEIGDLKGRRRYKAKKTIDKSKHQHDLVVEWLEDRQKALKEKTGNLQKHIQEMSRRQVIARYGDAPHRVKFTVGLKAPDQQRSFIVEMAHLDHMAHSVLTFLDMVRNKLWDNAAFAHEDSAEHVLMALPMNYQTGSYRKHYFKASGSSEVSFSEYSTHFPHLKYTLGFSGRGPEFYINTYDNTVSHGPGGQEYHDLPEDADPCFARVIEGKDVIDTMHSMTQSRSREFKHRYTHIVKVELL